MDRLTRESLQQRIVDAAREWLGTPFVRQDSTKGKGADCEQFIASVALESGAVAPDRPREVVALLASDLTFVSDRVEDARAGDVIAFCDGLLRNESTPRHVGFMTGYRRGCSPYIIHAGSRQIVEHRIDGSWSRRCHSVWRFRAACDESPLESPLELTKRSELKAALDAGIVADPFSLSAVAGFALRAVGLGRFSNGLLGALLTPKPQTQQSTVGSMSGDAEARAPVSSVWRRG
jgi:hypothetical protein